MKRCGQCLSYLPRPLSTEGVISGKKNEGKLYLKSGIELIIITIIEMESHCVALAGLKLTK